MGCKLKKNIIFFAYFFLLNTFTTRSIWQGSLLSNLLADPLYLYSIVIGGDIFDAAAAVRAFSGRYNNGRGRRPLRVLHTTAVQFDHQFENAKSSVVEGRASCSVPCPDSILWVACGREDGLRETLVAGAVQGWARKRIATNPRGWSAVCQQLLAEYFIETASLAGRTFAFEAASVTASATGSSGTEAVPTAAATNCATIADDDGGDPTSDTCCLAYNQFKTASRWYNDAKVEFKAQLPTWPSDAVKRQLTASVVLKCPAKMFVKSVILEK